MNTAERETTHEAVARRLRGQLAERRITHRQLGRMMGWKPDGVYRRMAAISPLDVNELQAISDALGIDSNWLLTGEHGEKRHYGPPV